MTDRRDAVDGLDGANGPDSGYWARVFAPAAAAQKYRAMIAAADLVGDAQTRALRRGAARWPGCLREARATPRPVYLARAQATEAALRQPATARATWRATGHAAVPLWWDLHALVATVQRWRRQRSRGSDRHDVAGFLRFAATDPHGNGWPNTAAPLGVGPVGTPMAQRWLAAQAGLDPRALRAILMPPRDAG